MPTCPKPKTETAEGSEKHVQANKKHTRTTPLTSLWCLHHQLQPYPISHANVSISDPEKANVHWAIKISRENTLKVKPTEVCQQGQ